MILLKNLLPSYEHLIIAFETMPMKELTMEYAMICLMHGMSKKEKKEPQGVENAMLLSQDKWNRLSHKNIKMWYYCGKPSHMVHFFYYNAINKN